VAARIAGRVTAVLADQGDPVERGRPLVRLDDAQLAADVRRSEATVQAVAAQLADLEAGARQEEISEARANVERARAQLTDLEAGSRPQEVDEVRERVRSAAATRVLAERDLGRVEALYARELVAAQEVDRARQAHAVALAQERALGETLSLALEGSRRHQVESARAQLRATEDRLALLLAGPRPHQVGALRAQLAEARAALALARERLADAVVTSPLEGFVVSRDLEPGATVGPGTTILKVADPRTVWVTAHVDEREVGLVAPGDRADVTLRSLPGRVLDGRVARVRRESDRVTEQLAVDVAFVEPPPRLTLGEQAEATLRPAGRQGVVALPSAALVRGRDGLVVLTVADGRLRFRAVRVSGVAGDGWVEALAGVRPGERVVVAPGRLADEANVGRRVTVRTVATPPTRPTGAR
jgi:HlyD family secretion protein